MKFNPIFKGKPLKVSVTLSVSKPEYNLDKVPNPDLNDHFNITYNAGKTNKLSEVYLLSYQCPTDTIS